MAWLCHLPTRRCDPCDGLDRVCLQELPHCHSMHAANQLTALVWCHPKGAARHAGRLKTCSQFPPAHSLHGGVRARDGNCGRAECRARGFPRQRCMRMAPTRHGSPKAGPTPPSPDGP